MNFISRLVTTAFLLPLSLGGVTEAKAADYCSQHAGYNFCAVYGRTDVMTISGNGDFETIQMVCRNGVAVDWKSNGTLSQFEVESAVDGFCSTRINSY